MVSLIKFSWDRSNKILMVCVLKKIESVEYKNQITSTSFTKFPQKNLKTISSSCLSVLANVPFSVSTLPHDVQMYFKTNIVVVQLLELG